MVFLLSLRTLSYEDSFPLYSLTKSLLDAPLEWVVLPIFALLPIKVDANESVKSSLECALILSTPANAYESFTG